MGLCEDVERTLKEIAPYYSGGFAGGHPRSASTSRAPSFPYDNTNDDMKSGVQSKEGEPLHHFIVPKNISSEDEETWSEDPTSLEEILEASGTPMNFTMPMKSSRGNDVPGSTASWNRSPPKPWDEEQEIKEDGAEFDAAEPPADPGPAPFKTNDEDQSDEDIAVVVKSSDLNLLNKDDYQPGDLFTGEEPETEVFGAPATGLDLVDVAVAQLFSGLLPEDSPWREFEKFSS